jgi:aminoglycoside phosphotransferase (APT) family kinase protein
MAEWAAEIEVGEELARTLIGGRYPALLRGGGLRRLGEGWDNVVWATAGDVVFRFPRRRIALDGVRREMALLPRLAPLLPLAIPDAAFPGAPTARFPWPWFGSRLVAGREIAAAAPLTAEQRIALAAPLARFLRALHGLELPAARALALDPMGRTDMAVRVPRTRDALARAGIDDDRARVLLEAAERLPAPGPAVLVHGDLHVRHLLVDDAGALTGVIDWGDVCRADRAADLSLLWSLLPPAGRAAFFDEYGGPLDEATLLRARVLALFLCALLAVYARDERSASLERESRAGLERALTTSA